ncbi:YSIRK-type signal peptide-containing protein, partial [Limosilactobacillus sp.]|uniref:YSIRK-type signal peptide-containing protein n=1 Tax=Limosilactobacillus sp. TaxID=2773925 RepID=UPI003F016CBF
MVSKNNKQLITKRLANREVPHYSLRKLGIGVVSVLLGTTMYLGTNNTVANADTVASGSDAQGANTPAETETQSSPVAGSTVALQNTSKATNNTNQQVDNTATAVNNVAVQSDSAKPENVQQVNNETAKLSTNSTNTQSEKENSTNNSSVSQTALSPASNEVATNNTNDDNESAGYVKVYPGTLTTLAGDGLKKLSGNSYHFKNGQAIDLDKIANDMTQALDKDGSGWSTVYKIYFVNNNNQKIDKVDPKQTNGGEYPVYARLTNVGDDVDSESQTTDADTEVQSEINRLLKPTINNKSFNQTIALNTKVHVLPETTWWSIFPQNEVINKFPKDGSDNLQYSRYTPATSDYLKALLTTGLPTIKSGGQEYYLVLSNSINSLSNDDFNNLINLLRPENKAKLEKQLSELKVDNGQLESQDQDSDNLIAANYMPLTEEQLTADINNILTPDNHGGGRTFIENTSYETNSVCLIPELDSKGNTLL